MARILKLTNKEKKKLSKLEAKKNELIASGGDVTELKSEFEKLWNDLDEEINKAKANLVKLQ